MALLEDPDEVVDPVEGEAGEDGVERVWFKGKSGFERGNDGSLEIDEVVKGKRSIPVEERRRGVGAGEMGDSSTDWCGDWSRRVCIWIRLGERAGNGARSGTEIEDVGKVSFDILDE